MKAWFVAVVFRSEIGDVEVDYMVDDVAEVSAIILDGPGYEAVVSIDVRRSCPEDAITVQQGYDRKGVLVSAGRRPT